jgi:hypothetical protein
VAPPRNGATPPRLAPAPGAAEPAWVPPRGLVGRYPPRSHIEASRTADAKLPSKSQYAAAGLSGDAIMTVGGRPISALDGERSCGA